VLHGSLLPGSGRTSSANELKQRAAFGVAAASGDWSPSGAFSSKDRLSAKNAKWVSDGDEAKPVDQIASDLSERHLSELGDTGALAYITDGSSTTMEIR